MKQKYFLILTVLIIVALFIAVIVMLFTSNGVPQFMQLNEKGGLSSLSPNSNLGNLPSVSMPKCLQYSNQGQCGYPSLVHGNNDINFYVSGGVVFSGKIYSDQCADNTELVKVYCCNSDAACYTNFTCPAGCLNGACLKCNPNCTRKNCGPDGCGGVCGNCNAGDKCSNGVCVRCIPLNCTQFKNQCGTWDNLCGGNVTCSCPNGESCREGTCKNCSTCISLGKRCGVAPDGCGNWLSCGAC